MPLISADALDFWLQRLNPALSVSRSLARLVARTAVAHDTVQLTFPPNRAFRGARPGQRLQQAPAQPEQLKSWVMKFQLTC